MSRARSAGYQDTEMLFLIWVTTTSIPRRLYGFGKNEELLNKAIGHRRSEYFLASKCGLYRDASGKREINGRPEVLTKTCEDSLRELGTDCIDLYYLHRIDLNVQWKKAWAP